MIWRCSKAHSTNFVVIQTHLSHRFYVAVDFLAYANRRMKAALRAMRNKTDRNDARGIAHVMRTGWFRLVHVKSPESQELRLLLTHRRTLQRKALDIENEIRGTLKAFGLQGFRFEGR